jgi:uncharacterized protein YciI
MGFVFRLLPPRPSFPQDTSADERATMLDHVGYWPRLAQEGTVLGFGPVNDPSGPYGIAIVLAESQTAAERIRDQDPAALSPYGFTTELAPMMLLVTPSHTFEAQPA